MSLIDPMRWSLASANADDYVRHLEQGQLDVGDGHSIHWNARGNPDAPVVLVVHGGPGTGHDPRMAEFFDLDLWRIVMFDQRGCGQSKPLADTRRNDTGALVADMELLRCHLGIRKWMLCGGSWGTRLSLEYGASHVDRCTGFMLRGIFLGRAQDIRWFLWDARQLFPDAHDLLLDEIEALAGTRPHDAESLLRLAGEVLAPAHPERQRIATAWDTYETAMCAVRPLAPPQSRGEAGIKARSRSLSTAVLEHHYMLRVLPGTSEDVLDRVERLTHLPCEIVHGRYDAICPLEQAWQLRHAWPGAVLGIAPTSGHWPHEPEMAALMHAASARMRMRVCAE